jgi:hypothetical protein
LPGRSKQVALSERISGFAVNLATILLTAFLSYAALDFRRTGQWRIPRSPGRA